MVCGNELKVVLEDYPREKGAACMHPLPLIFLEAVNVFIFKCFKIQSKEILILVKVNLCKNFMK